VAQQAFEHRRDLGGRVALKLTVDAQLLALDVPVDHYAGPAVADMELRHQAGVPGAEPLGVAGDGGGVAPPAWIPVFSRVATVVNSLVKAVR
jgi:hypothetical protein